MKRLFSLLLCLMICVLNISSLPAAHASAAEIKSKVNFFNTSGKNRVGQDWTTLSPDDLWHAWNQNCDSFVHYVSDDQIKNCVGCVILNIRFNQSDARGYIYCIALPDGCSNFIMNSRNQLSFSYVSEPVLNRCIAYNVSNNTVINDNYTFTGSGNPIKFPYINNNYSVNYLTEVVYSDYDVKNEAGDVIYQAQNYDFSTNDDWFSVSSNPSLAADMNLTNSYTNSKGEQVTTADYSLDVTVTRTGEIYSDNDSLNHIYQRAQCFCFVSTEPVTNRDYTAALNSCTYLHYEKTQYIADLVVQPGAGLDINGYDHSVSQRENMIRLMNYEKAGGDMHAFLTNRAVVDYSEVFGYVPYKVFDWSVPAEFTIDLQGVHLTEGQTYYFNVIAVPLNTFFCRNLDFKPIVNQNTLTYDGEPSGEWGEYSPLAYMQNLEDISECKYSCKSIPFSFSTLEGYTFDDKSDDFGIDPYQYSDDKLKSDDFDDTVQDRDDLSFKDGSIDSIVKRKSLIGEWEDIGGGGSASSGIMSTFGTIIPFFRLAVLAFPENMQGTVSFLIMIPFVLLLIAVIIAGIKFLISLFSG